MTDTRQPNYTDCIELISNFDELSLKEQISQGPALMPAFEYISSCSGVPVWWLIQFNFSGDETPELLRLAYSGWSEADDAVQAYAEDSLDFPEPDELDTYEDDDETYDFPSDDRNFDIWRSKY